jgi:hypothetical protein
MTAKAIMIDLHDWDFPVISPPGIIKLAPQLRFIPGIVH